MYPKFKSIEVNGFPISLVFGANRIFFSERITGNIWEVLAEDKFMLIRHFPVVQVTGHHETGLLGLALDPEFAKNNYIYAFYTYGADIGEAKNKVVRFQIGEESEEILLDELPANRIHNGGIIGFGPDKKLYVLIGVDNAVMEKSQDIKYLGGKVLRINSDGTIPADNPFKNSPVYTYGHRNLFGIAFHPKTGEAYISEDGPDENDEINILEKGGNYGWPKVTGIVKKAEYVNPIIAYTPTITPTQCCFDGNDFYFGSYNEGSVHKLTLDTKNSEKVISDKIVYQGRPFGTIGVFCSPDGDFYVATPSSILKFNPIKA